MKKLILVLAVLGIGCGEVPLISSDGLTCISLAPGEDLPSGVGEHGADGPNRECTRWCSSPDGTKTGFWVNGVPVGADPRVCE